MTSPSPKGDGKVADWIADKAGIQLDLGCGEHKQPGFVGIDVRDLPGVDIIHDLNVHPWPLPDECAIRIMASHLVEHIPPVAVGPLGTWFPFMAFMDEVWRIAKPGGELMISAPYWTSPGFAQDPTHINAISEVTFAYFDPMHHSGLWGIYKPKPWYYSYVSFDPQWSIEVLLRKHSEDPDLWQKERDLWGPPKSS